MSHFKSRSLVAGALVAALLALPAGIAAAASELDGTVLGKTADEVTASLTQHGYEVRKVVPEDGMLEAYALKDGKRFEIYVDQTSGQVARVGGED